MGGRNFKNGFTKRMFLFDKLMLYGAEMGMKKREDIERLQDLHQTDLGKNWTDKYPNAY